MTLNLPRLHGPEPPQGKDSGRSLLFSLLPPHLQYSPPQPFGGVFGPVMAYEDLDIMVYEDPTWFNIEFQQRIPLTINGGQVPSAQTDFPLLINDTYSDLIGEVEAELRFAGSDNIQLEYEIQTFDNVTGELIAWVKKPSLTDGDIINIYFDNPGAIDEQNPNAVWDPDYKMVLHMEPNLLDSTSNANNATNDGTSNTTGKIGRARIFNVIMADNLRIVDSASLQPAKITLSYWIQSNQTADGCIICKSGVTAGDEPYKVRRLANALIRFTILTLDFPSPLNLLGTTTLSTTLFSHIVETFDGVTMKSYINGVLDTSVGRTGDIDNTAVLDLFIGVRNSSLIEPFNGTLDEIHISSVARSDDYILTEFNNQNAPGTFYSTGAVEQVPTIFKMAYQE